MLLTTTLFTGNRSSAEQPDPTEQTLPHQRKSEHIQLLLECRLRFLWCLTEVYGTLI